MAAARRTPARRRPTARRRPARQQRVTRRHVLMLAPVATLAAEHHETTTRVSLAVYTFARAFLGL